MKAIAGFVSTQAGSRPAIVLSERNKIKIEAMIKGIHGFLFLDKNGKSKIAIHWQKYFQRICQKYNKIYKIEMPKVTPHVCRHTFCSNKAKSGMNPKTLQYIMGHSDIRVTLNTYTHVGFEDAKEETERMNESSNFDNQKTSVS